VDFVDTTHPAFAEHAGDLVEVEQHVSDRPFGWTGTAPRETGAASVGARAASPIVVLRATAVASAIGRKTNPRMLGLGVTPRQAKMPELGDPVVKFGAGNNRSYGIVKRIGIVRMNFGGAFADVLIPCCYIARDTAVDQVETGDQVRELVRPGDSGCVWMLRKKGPANVSRPQLRESMTQDPRKEMDPPQPEDEYLRATETAVALHFGADDAVEELALAVSMPMVLDQLNVTLAYPPAEKS